MVKNLPANTGDIRDTGSIPGSGRSPGGGHCNPLQYSCLENPMDRGAWWAVVHRFSKSQTQLKWLGTHREKLLPILAFAWTTSGSLYHLSYSYKLMNSLVTQMVKNTPAVWETRVWSLGQEDSLKKGMATHSSILAWRIPWTEEPGGPLSMGSQRVRYDWVTTVSLSMNGHQKAEWVSYP